MKLLSINTVGCVSNAPARIMLNISEAVEAEMGSAIVCYGRGNCNSNIKKIKIGSDLDFICHTLKSRLFDSEGLHSLQATKCFIERIKYFKPDIIQLHNLHGHYLNYPILFEFLKEYNHPVIWTLHDCWAFTGHCSYFSMAKCEKWKSKCGECRQRKAYPVSWFIDKSERNYIRKKELFAAIPNLHIVAVSEWLKKQVEQSFLRDYPIHVIPNGIDTNVFKPMPIRKSKNNKKIILCVASMWEKRKGLDDILALSQFLPEDYELRIVGSIPYGAKINSHVKLIPQIADPKKLAEIYCEADVFINSSKEETFGMTTIEALSCGTPMIVNDSTALTEIVSHYPKDVAKVIDTSVTDLLFKTITEIVNNPDCEKLREEGRNLTVQNYSAKQMTRKYLQLIEQLCK